MKRVLLVGGAGYVGTVLSEELLDRGYAVRILDRLYYGDESLEDVRDRIELIPGDMRRPPDKIFEGISAVINIGGLSNDPTAEYNPKANYEMNTKAAVCLAEHCLRYKIPRYVFASSCSVYDRGVGNEDLDLVLDEDSEVEPKAAYSTSKRDAEIALIKLASEDFCPVILRKGTIYGYSPRMRFDLVVNTFVKDALSKGYITLHYGGEMWRPLVDVRDVARAYILALEAESSKLRGQIFNVVYKNFRISEVALRVRQALQSIGVVCDVRADYGYKGVRNYRVSGKKIEHVLGLRCKIGIEESAVNMANKMRGWKEQDFENPKCQNIRWMQLLERAKNVIAITGDVF